MSANSDWAGLDIDLFVSSGNEVKLSEVWTWVKHGQKVASESGLILLQSRAEFHDIMKAISADARTANRRAMRVTRHYNKIIDHLDAAKAEFGKIPVSVRSVFAAEIEATKNTSRKRVDLGG